jgi:hypothetical protein
MAAGIASASDVSLTGLSRGGHPLGLGMATIEPRRLSVFGSPGLELTSVSA